MVSDYVLQRLEKKYGKFDPLNTTQGKIHDYLGMVLYFSTIGKVIVTMTKQIQITLDTKPTETESLADTPAVNQLFHFQENYGYMSMQNQDLYKTPMANILSTSC